MGGQERILGGIGRSFGLRRLRYENENEGPPLKIDRTLGRRLQGYLRPYTRQGVGIFGCVCLSSILGVAPPQIVRFIIDIAIPTKDLLLLSLLAGVMVALPFLTGLIIVLQNYLTIEVGQGLMYDLRNALYRHLQKLSLRFYTKTRSGEIIARISNDVGAIREVIRGTFVQVLTNVLTVAATLAMIFSMNWRLACLATLVIPAFIFPTRRVGKLRQRLTGETHEKQAEISSHLFETLNLGGFILTRIFGRELYERGRFEKLNARLKELEIRQAMAGRWLFMVLSLFGAVGPALIYWYGGYQSMMGDLTVGIVIAFVAYLGSLYRPLSQLANVYVEVRGAMAVFARIFEYLDIEPEVKDAPDAIVLRAERGEIEFREVAFSYDGQARVLEDINFKVESGSMVALVGPSGAGKTTLTYLVPRFYDSTAGAIIIDGLDLRKVTLSSLEKQIGMVTQETFLFHASIRENLIYANPDASEEEIIAASQAAHIHDTIDSLPLGYDTVVGERGFRLSGGERQRVAIARVILKNPRILILDEATSSLDSESEAAIQEALEPLLNRCTSLVIAHRLSTVLAADKIIVLDGGRIVESGNHASLLARGGLYATLYDRQFRRGEKVEGGTESVIS